jgi:eukaryotic-like serine/threonine-protein kinase
MSMESSDKPGERLDETEFEASLVSGPETGQIGASTHGTQATDLPALEPETRAMPQPAWAGKVLGHFKLLRRIGEGRMGMVIQAQDINLHRIVALKVLNKRLPGMAEEQRVLQFLREARAAAQIEHPNVVRIHEINQHSGWWYIAMEMIEGGNLRSLVKAGGPLPVPRACSLIADAAAALAVTHQFGIVHRDIKPTNLMLTRQGRCKLTDFGLVRIDDPNDPFDFTDKAVGSPQFMAPEMIARGSVTPAVDVYSLGNTLYYALAAEAPYTGHSVDEILNKHLTAPIPDIRQKLPDCPATLALLIRRSMSKTPGERPSAADFCTSLRGEMVGYPTDDSGVFATTGAVSGSGLQHATSHRTPGQAAGVAEKQLASTFIRSPRFLLVTAVLAGILLGTLCVSILIVKVKERRPIDLARYFPDAPATYGVATSKGVPATTEPSGAEAPGFSWVGKVDARDFRFVASRSGVHYYSVGSGEAALIRSDSLVGYRTAAEAAADGKAPASR